MKKDSCTKYLNPFKKRLIVGPIFKLIEAIFELIVPILMARIIDIGIKNSDKIYYTIYRHFIYVFAPYKNTYSDLP